MTKPQFNEILIYAENKLIPDDKPTVICTIHGEDIIATMHCGEVYDMMYSLIRVTTKIRCPGYQIDFNDFEFEYDHDTNQITVYMVVKQFWNWCSSRTINKPNYDSKNYKPILIFSFKPCMTISAYTCYEEELWDDLS